MTSAATAVSGAFLGWYIYDEYLTARLAKKAKPMPLPQNPTYKTEDVSIIVATINTPDSFTASLRLWLANRPKEVIIVTIERDLQRVVDLVQPVASEWEDRITVTTAQYASKRAQMVVGMQEAKGKILACVDDDAFWGYTTLEHLIAPFEDPKVGGAVGKQSAHIPQNRQNSKVITPWEVASIKSLDNQNNIQAVRFAADGGVFCLVGRTLMMRADIAKEPRFQHAINNEFIQGKRLNTGDDVFITRWLQCEGWDMSIQNAPEAEITTEVMRDSKLVLQMFRWQRSAIQSFLKTILDEPGLRKIWKKHPYMARKLVERLLRPILSWVHVFVLIQGCRENSMVAIFAVFWYFWGMVRTYNRFLKQFPYATGKIWAAVLLDNCYPIVDIWAWLTLSTEAYGTRNPDTEA